MFIYHIFVVLSRNVDDGINMDDLDQLQIDLETLLSICAVRNRFLRNEIESIDRVEEKRDRKGKSYDKVCQWRHLIWQRCGLTVTHTIGRTDHDTLLQGSLKRKRLDDKGKYKDARNGTRPIKKHYGLPVGSVIGEPGLRREVPKNVLPKNETYYKFWAYVEPYCGPITPAHQTV